MPGDYTRFTFDPARRYAAVRLQQGRVQLDSEWNENADILRERTRLLGLDTGGPAWAPPLTTPNAFLIGALAGPPPDLSIGEGRFYLDGRLAEVLPGETATYLHQPFLPAPPPYNPNVDTLVYLDLWERDVTWIEDAGLIDKALGGVDTATRVQQVWQVKLFTQNGLSAACGVDLGALFPASGGQLTTSAVAPPAPSDPCILPPNAGYRGVENRLYRVEVQTGGALGAAKFKWSRDNGSVVSRVSKLEVAGGQTRVTVNRIGRDKALRFLIGKYVTLTDDDRELNSEAGEMALVVAIDEAARVVTLDRAVPTGGGRSFGANADELTARNTRLQRWDQTGPLNPLDADGLMTTGAGPIELEDGVLVSFSVAAGGGPFKVGDYWVFAARTADASVEILDHAPPRGVVHQYLQLAAIPAGATPQDCRPKPAKEECCCTVVVSPGQSIQKAIDSLPKQGGCVCLKAGLHVIDEPLTITGGNVLLHGESLGAVISAREGPMLFAQRASRLRVSTLEFRVEAGEKFVIGITACDDVALTDCIVTIHSGRTASGIYVVNSSAVALRAVRVGGAGVVAGFLIDEGSHGTTISDCAIRIGEHEDPGMLTVGIWTIKNYAPFIAVDNAIVGANYGIVVNDDANNFPQSSVLAPIIRGNTIRLAENKNPDLRCYGIDVAGENALVEGNIVEHAGGAVTGIRLCGDGAVARDNAVESKAKTAGGAIAVAAGDVVNGAPVSPAGVTIAGTRINGAQHGILLRVVEGAKVEGNMLGDAEPLDGAGIALIQVGDAVVSGNLIRSRHFGVWATQGARNRIDGNVIAGGAAGIGVIAEIAPTVRGNRIMGAALFGIAYLLIAQRCETIGNRVLLCGAAGAPGVGVGALAVWGEWHVEGNEIMDTGLPPVAGGGAAPTAYGVAGLLILEARVANNLVTYSDVTQRSVAGEDRALMLMGYLEISLPQVANVVIGFAVQIADNRFTGASASALVELLEIALSASVLLRFERVLVSGNHLAHLCGDINKQRATLSLVGRACSVSGNHVKPSTGDYFSVHFHDMPGPYIGNVTGGDTLGRATAFPAPQNAFNMKL